MRITILGCGYVGLVSGACLADAGHSVTCVDLDEARVAQLKRGAMPVFEPGLEALVAATVASGRLSFSVEIAEAIANARVVLLAVGTPSRRGDGHADLTYVYRAAETVGKALSGFTVVVAKSTVPVGTSDQIERILAMANPEADFAVVSNPEFLRQGAAIRDFQHPARIVIGTDDARASAVLEDMYAPFTRGGAHLLRVSRRTAELIKYAGNAFLAMKLTFINEMADLCEVAGADVTDLAHGMGLDDRIAPGFLEAGPGYGGSCLPKDARALVRTASELGCTLSLVEATISANERRHRAMAQKVVEACGGSVRGLRIAMLGLTFKPGTDDMREAPSLAIIAALQRQGASIAACDPHGGRIASGQLAGVELSADAYKAASGADAVVVVTGWPEFRALDLGRLGASMRQRVLVDLRNICHSDDALRHGFRYRAIGQPDRHVVGLATLAGEAARDGYGQCGVHRFPPRATAAGRRP
jgi:UDPglucose 6-dehydrogenase